MSTEDTLVCYELHPIGNPLRTSPDVVTMVNGCITIQELPASIKILHVILITGEFFVQLRGPCKNQVVKVLDDSQRRFLWTFKNSECYDYTIIEHIKFTQERKYSRSISDFEARMYYDLMYYRMKTGQLQRYISPEHTEAKSTYEYHMDAAIARFEWVNHVIEELCEKYNACVRKSV
jgi:hypothetical protein